ncbi:RibD family protein [Anoxynatronum buryatiense]|uniref:Pyrimidine reductase, riboflavin biosynthesis n=1 Tax=Anoxynatronum buryatiense TaxID=489973 RepID=A0AA45WXK3_9CLOT|nr:dihydrofolate reductase family protein [Anoxynatronum buryatiense]SMP65068.1 Pyrimidine reductase, riboflavin biosynthesis [Anoxynatronum buryatiense]
MLKKIAFPASQLPLQCLYRNENLLRQMAENADFRQIPEKVERVYGPLLFPAAPPDRPYLTGCLVLSLDGRLGFENEPSSRTLTSANKLDHSQGKTDLWMVNLVRTWADAVLLGTGTLKEEPEFTGHVYDPDLQAFREAHDSRFCRNPWNVMITRRPGDLPWQHPVLSTPQIPVLLVVPGSCRQELVDCPGGRFCYGVIDGANPQETAGMAAMSAQMVNRHLEKDPEGTDPRHVVITLPDDNFPDFHTLLPLLRQLGIRQMAVESPHWIWHLMAEKKLDEFFLTHTGVYAGGNVLPGTGHAFQPASAPQGHLASLHMTPASVLFSRQVLIY